MRISLIGTTHAERGLANTGELLAILERCKPEVIFAEIPATHAERYANASHATLESIAVARYLASNQAEVVPVDLAEPEEKFFDDSKEMFTAVERRSPKYRSLVDRNTDEVRAGGFRYLNSDQCMQAWEDIYREVLETIEWIGDRRLREIYDLWSHVMRAVTEMMRNIGSTQIATLGHVEYSLLVLHTGSPSSTRLPREAKPDCLQSSGTLAAFFDRQ